MNYFCAGMLQLFVNTAQFQKSWSEETENNLLKM